ncbi:Lactonase, 7-bladed beta-propeller-domain-containing protein [Kockovaella imperatae]|uniref:Lactonase, 7-bladed beta-propeller-domain-containing protein n=1 Tax=Kockovaella imperatae TaxID=4999 RepID=A0A1Y1ULW3_9TREE|nr:Lactonase, 7-bladed beta-propeller-domain-containing protein [Kockovaella imperatae]ORX38989.1 Lactonase, 7-bladed beta-propeller-domain-containing protein [Kockovaella imperatae]
MSTEHLLLLGTNIDKIYGVIFDEKAKTLRKTAENELAPKSSWIIQHPNIADLIYFNAAGESKLFAGTFDRHGKVTILDEAQQSEESKGPCHFALAPDNSALIVANYHSGNICMLPLNDNGRFMNAKTEPSLNFTPPHKPVDHPRQTEAHAHQIVVHDGRVLVPDLGSNKVWRIRPGHGDDQSRWVLEGAVEGFDVGDGPRHVVVHPNGRILYVLNEISSELTAHTLPSDPSKPSELLSRHTLLPPSDQGNGPKMKASALIYLPPLAPTGNAMLIGSNRDSPRGKDALAVFSVDPEGRVERAPTPWIEDVAQSLRGVAADKSGRFVCAAGEESGGLVVYERVGNVELRQVARLDEVEKVIAPLWV